MQNLRQDQAKRQLYELMEIGRQAGLDVQTSFLFAFAWLLRATGHSEGTESRELLDPDSWLNLDKELGAVGSFSGLAALPMATLDQLLKRAYAVFEPLAGTPELDAAQLADLSWVALSQYKGMPHAVQAMDPALADLLVQTLEPDRGDQVWVPFDTSGQLALRIAKAGATVWLARPAHHPLALIQLICAHRRQDPWTANLRFDSLGDVARQGLEERLTHGLFTPPFAAQMGASYWAEFEQVPRVRRFMVDPQEFQRSDTRAIATLWPTVSRVAVFMVSPGVLFGAGQEARLRRSLLQEGPGNAVSGVIQLPNGLLAHSTISTGILLLAEDPLRQATRMVDLSGSQTDGRVTNRFGKDLDVAHASNLLARDIPVPDLAVLVTPDEARDADYSLAPSRYVKWMSFVGEHRVALQDLLLTAELRASPALKDPDALTVWEIGPAQLDQWRSIKIDPERSTRIARKKLDKVKLRVGDLVLSIKGSIGKVGYFDDRKTTMAQNIGPDPHRPDVEGVVPAQSCIGLRVDPSKVLPEYLFAFMRSEDFMRQIQSLQVGAVISHVTPNALLNAIRVPLPSLEEQSKIALKYKELRDLEQHIAEQQERLKRMHHALFDAAVSAVATTNDAPTA